MKKRFYEESLFIILLISKNNLKTLAHFVDFRTNIDYLLINDKSKTNVQIFLQSLYVTTSL